MARSRRRAFEATAVVYLHEMFRVARRVTGDTAAAEDVVQETFLRAWQAFDRFEPGTNARAWLYKILFRTLGARHRDLQRDLAMFDHEAFDESRHPQGLVESLFTSQRIHKACAELPLALITVIQLVDVEGLSYREASVALDVPVGTVMSRLHRARRKLREKLEPQATLVRGARERS